jgi:hypothetical protein
MTNDIFRTVRELIQSNKCVLMGNAVNNEGELYDDSVENLTAILALKDSHSEMLAALENLMDGACEALSFLDRETVRHLKPLIDSAETAIAKAKGN